MSWRLGIVSGAALLVVVTACGKRGPAPTLSVALDDTMAALVGDQVIDLQTVQRIVATRHVSPREAVELAVEDALLAERAKSELPTYAPGSHLQRVVLARALMEQIREQAKAKGPPTEAELSNVIDGWWWELDRPEMFRVIHAVVRLDKSATPEQDESARALAEKIRAAVLGAKPNDFRKRVDAIDKGSFKVKIEALSPVASDGRTFDPKHPPKRGDATGRYDATFAGAAAALREVGDASPVVKTPFGYHVLMLVERVSAQRVPQDELDSEVFDQRARQLQDELLTSLRAGTSIVVLDQAPALTGLVRVGQ